MTLATELKMTVGLAVLSIAILSTWISTDMYWRRQTIALRATLADYKADRVDYEKQQRVWKAALTVAAGTMPKGAK